MTDITKHPEIVLEKEDLIKIVGRSQHLIYDHPEMHPDEIFACKVLHATKEYLKDYLVTLNIDFDWSEDVAG